MMKRRELDSFDSNDLILCTPGDREFDEGVLCELQVRNIYYEEGAAT
jgi:hypothetical protein